VLSVTACVSMGTAAISLGQVWGILLHQIPGLNHWLPRPDWPASSEQILLKVRLPRVVLGILIGASLAVAGAGFQGVLRNPLADPYTLGVSSGASVGAAFIILFGLQYSIAGEWSVPLVAFATGMITLWLVVKLAQVQGKLRMETLILAGVVMQAFLGAAVSFMVSMTNQVVNDILFWLMGSLTMRGWSYSGILLPYLLVGLFVLLGCGRSLNLFTLGERQAAYLGVHVERTKLIVLGVSTLVTAAAVSVSGVIGFVGLIVPHLIRLMTGPDYRLLLPLSAIGGALYVVWADTLARMVLSPVEIPLGVVTAFLGAPFFAYLLYQHKKTIKG